jgi:ComF family protein
MIKRIKVDAYAPQLRQLGELLAITIRAAYGPGQRPDIIIPLPLHWSRQLRRGFNQSQGIAQILVTGLHGSKINNHSLRRRGYRRPQHLLGQRQRLQSMQGAFEVGTVKPLEGRTVALVDDVITTGATASAAAKALLAAGVSAVDIWCIARTGWHIDAA